MYEVLLSEFIDGDFVPGERLKDDELAQRLNVSRTPVREALARLGAAGMVDTAPNRYTRVSQLYSSDLEIAANVLEKLYRLGLERVAADVGPDDIHALELLGTRVATEWSSDPYRALTALGQFCSDRLDSPILKQLIGITQPRLLRVLRMGDPLVLAEEAVAGAQRMIRALQRQDAAQVAAVLESVFEPARARLKSSVDRARLRESVREAL